MLLNKVYEEYDYLEGELKGVSDEIGVIISECREAGVPLTTHRIRLWEWPILVYAAKQSGNIGNVLDIGIGGSPLLLWFKRNGWNCFGCDIGEINPKFKTYCEKEGIKFFNSNIFELPFEDEHFDYVMSTCVLEHIDKLAIERRQDFRMSIVRGLEETLRVLKPGRLSAHTVDFMIQGFNQNNQFNKTDLKVIADCLKQKAEVFGGVDYDVLDPFDYYTRESPVHAHDSERKILINKCLALKMRLRDAHMRTCASVVLRKV